MTHPLDSQKDEPRVATKDGGDRTAAGSNYGDYVPPPERAHVQSALPDQQLPAEVAPEDPDAELIKAQRAQRQAHATPEQSIDGESAAGEEDPGAADDVMRSPSSGPEGVVPRRPL